MKRWKSIDGSGGTIGAGAEGMTVDGMWCQFADDAPRRTADAAPQLHLWLPSRTHDASAAAPGELRAGSPVLGSPASPREAEARLDDQEEPADLPGPPAPAAMPLATPKQRKSEPMELFDQKNGVRLSGRDENGQLWNAHLWLPQGERAGENMRVEGSREMRSMGDGMLRNLEHNSGNMVAGLGAYQRMLDRHYQR